MWQNSKNYMWYTEDILGKGAFGCVYKGVSRITSESVAVKTFKELKGCHQEVIDRYLRLQIREFKTLERVNHENVVKLLAIEENEKHEKVIVMQLCTGGSLHDIIEHPENVYGLNENEFLIVLNHITEGMKYLRAENLVHRDLKPGNIMRFVCDDGKIIYKLGDFGSARELNDNQVFQSLYGTEEYLHPDLYEAALIRPNQNRVFGPKVDLWSIGVTLYHVATGDLPFQAYDGRNDRRKMFEIISQKPNKAISGIQRTYNGQVEFAENLPNSCQLSYCLKVYLTSLLVGLLEADSTKSWSFDKYFNAVDDILSRKIINVFYMNQTRLIKIYLHRNENYQNFQNYIYEQTKIQPNNQIFLFKSKFIINLNSSIETTKEEPLYLFDKNNNTIIASINEDLPKFSNFSDDILQFQDTKKAKYACSIGYICKRRIEQYCLICQHFTKAVINFNRFIQTELNELKQISHFLYEKNTIIAKIIPIISAYQQHTTNTSFIIKSNITQENFKDVCDKIKQLHQHNVSDNDLENKWNKFVETLNDPCTNRALQRTNSRVECLESSWKFLKSLIYTNLSYNGRKSYKLKRTKIENSLNKIKQLLQEVYQQYCQLTGKFNDWYQILKNLLSELIVLKNSIIKFRDGFKPIELIMKNEDFLMKLGQTIQTSYRNRNRTHNYKQLKVLLENYNNKNDKIREILKENDLLLEQIDNILQTINFPLEIQLEHDITTTINKTVNNQKTQDILNENSSLIEEIIQQIEYNFSTLTIL